VDLFNIGSKVNKKELFKKIDETLLKIRNET
jgi:hypothetical protein